MLPKAVVRLAAELGKLPGIGPRNAERLAADLLAKAPERPLALAEALTALVQTAGTCPTCFFYTDEGACPFCQSSGRDTSTLVVVELALEVLNFERAGVLRPLYHVLGGSLSPLKGRTPSKLRFAELFTRLRSGAFREVVLATSPGAEGDATANYILAEMPVCEGLVLTRLGRGVPMGGALENTDAGTLKLALEARRPAS